MKLFVRTADRMDGVSSYRVRLTENDVENLTYIVDHDADAESALLSLDDFTWSDGADDALESMFATNGGYGYSDTEMLDELRIVCNDKTLKKSVYFETEDSMFALTADDTSDMCDHFDEEY